MSTSLVGPATERVCGRSVRSFIKWWLALSTVMLLTSGLLRARRAVRGGIVDGRWGTVPPMPRHVVTVVVIAAAGAVSAAGCGGPIQRDELQRGVQSLGAIAEEGRLLARDVARDCTKTTFVRVHARDLGDAADHEAEKLADAQAEAGVATVKGRAVKLAQQLAGALGDLQVRPGDEATGASVAGRLASLAAVARRFEDQL